LVNASRLPGVALGPNGREMSRVNDKWGALP
jgi:hypothetical protein